MRLSPARVTIALAAPAGVLAGHALGYLAGDPHAGPHAVDHSYLAVAAAGFGPLAVAALLWTAVSGTRSGPRVPVGALLAAQWALFAGQEMAEHALAGHAPADALRSPAVWLGMGAQGLVALALGLLLRAAAITGARVLASLARLVRGATAATGWPPSTGLRSPSFLPARRPNSRGPPPLLA